MHIRGRRPVLRSCPFVLLSLGLILAGGCAPVPGNYPPPKVPAPELPAAHKTRSGDQAVVVWDRPGELRGFQEILRHTSERAEAFRQLAAAQPAFAADADLFAGLAGEDLAELVMAVYIMDGVKLRARTGDFVVRYADGTEVRDQGVLYVEPRDPQKRRRFSREATLTLSSEPVGKRNPLTVMLFVPAADLGKPVAAVQLAPRG